MKSEKTRGLYLKVANGRKISNEEVCFEEFDDGEIVITVGEIRIYAHPEDLINIIRETVVGF